MVASEPFPDTVAVDDLVGCCHALAAAGLVPQASGNLSVRAGAQVLITATGARCADLTEADVVTVDEGGAVSGDTGTPSSELALHLEVYRRRPDVGAVVHTHGRHAVALSTVATSVPALHYYCVQLGGPPPVAAYRTYGTPELAAVTVDALGAGHAVVMAHHGALAVGPDLATARDRAELVEWLCEVALLALAAGRPAELTAAQLADVVARRRGVPVP